jgi:photosystem II stability/assembly factor-like uncharacterized protein
LRAAAASTTLSGEDRMARPHRALAASLAAVAVLVTAGGLVRAAPANTLDAALFDSLAWRPIGPDRPGTVTAVAIPSATTWFAGTRAGGLWRTVDAGRTWSAVLDASSIGAVAIAPGDPDVVYAGTGNPSADAPAGDGLFVSTDAGRTWTRTGLAACRAITAIAVDPADARRVFVAAAGDAYAPDDARGIFRSLDGGRTFTRVLAAGPHTDGVGIALDPVHPQVLYAAMHERRARAGSRAFTAGPGTGLFASTDGGATWHAIDAGLPAFEADGLQRITIALGGGTPARLFAGITARTRGGLYRSDDGGQSWTRVHEPLADPAADLSVTVDPRDANVVYVVSTGRIWRSADAGQTFDPAWPQATSIAPTHLWIAHANPDVVMSAGAGVARATINGGETWRDVAPPGSSLSALAADGAFPYRVCGVTADANTWCVSTRSRAASALPFPGGSSVAPDPQDPAIVYGGGVARYDRASAQVQDVGPAGVLRRGLLRFADMDPRTLLFATDRLWTTNTGGLTWSAPSTPLTRAGAPPAPPPGTAPRVVTALTTSSVDRRTIWTGTSDGAIHLTRDAGTTWADVTPSLAPEWAAIASIEASHFDPASAYAAVDAHRLGDDGPHVLRTRDAGATWTDIGAALPAHALVHAVREDAQRRGLLFAATDQSVFVSFDDGESWQPLRIDLPQVPVLDLLIKDADLVASTAGRGLWILDDISPLRQMTADLSRADAFLFRPSTAWRIQPAADAGAGADATPPPDGVAFDYLLGPGTTGPVTIEIREAVSGELLRHYSSEASATDGSAPLAATPGLHRLVWDLRYAPPARPPAGPSGDEPQGARRGVWVKPGTYQVRLTAGPHVVRQAVVVKLDPRVRASAADLDAQFDVATRLSQAMDALATRAGGGTPGASAPDVVAAWNTLADLFDRVLAADARPTPAVSETADAAIARARGQVLN